MNIDLNKEEIGLIVNLIIDYHTNEPIPSNKTDEERFQIDRVTTSILDKLSAQLQNVK